MIYVVENSNKFKNTKFWKEKSIENVVTLGPTTHVFARSNITFQITNKSNNFMPYFFATTFYVHVKQATLNKDMGKSHPFSKL